MFFALGLRETNFDFRTDNYACYLTSIHTVQLVDNHTSFPFAKPGQIFIFVPGPFCAEDKCARNLLAEVKVEL